MTVSKYRVTVKHDHGTAQIVTAASSEQEARIIVMKSEGCPPQAITKVKQLKP